MIEIEFVGAAKGVTGSKHLLRTSRATVLLDCGLFQGHRKEANEKNAHIPIDVSKLDAVVLSHAHIDHSGALPSLYKMGYRGPIFATHATRDLCSPMLMDIAWIMKNDSEHIRKLIKRGAKHLEPFEPLYDDEDATGTLALFVGVAYHKPHEIAPGIKLTLLDAGHILGSAICVLDVEDEGETRRLAFTGDLGRKNLPILRDPETPTGVDILLTESTYGDRLHEPIEDIENHLADTINQTVERGGKIVIPSFALERAQEVIYAIKKLRNVGRIPPIPVFVDSPLTIKLTDIFKLHPECYDKESFKLLENDHSIFDFPELKYTASVEESKRISSTRMPCIIISASGMCEGGRILHHLKSTVEDHRNTVLIVGYQAEHTLGRRIVERQPKIRIFGEMYELRAEVRVLSGLSAHADQAGLIRFANEVKEKGNLKSIFLIHGEPSAQKVLQEKMEKGGLSNIHIPNPGERFKVSP